MTKLLYVNGSPRSTDSRSNEVAQEFLTARRKATPGIVVDTIDLWREPLPEFDGDKVAAKMTVIGGGQLTGATSTAWDEIQRIARRFTDADEYLFTVPMWNGGVPYRLKLYIDILTQPGILFSFDPAKGYAGLLRDKRATSIYTSAVYSPGVPGAFGADFHSTYFEDWLHFIGIRDVTAIRFQRTALANDYDGDLAKAVEAARTAAGA